MIGNRYQQFHLIFCFTIICIDTDEASNSSHSILETVGIFHGSMQQTNEPLPLHVHFIDSIMMVKLFTLQFRAVGQILHQPLSEKCTQLLVSCNGLMCSSIVQVYSVCCFHLPT